MLTTAAAEMKTNATNYYYMGFAQNKLGHGDQAITALNQGLAIDPKDADSLTLLAIFISLKCARIRRWRSRSFRPASG